MKKIMTNILAAALCAATMTSISANARTNMYLSDSEKAANIEGFTRVDNIQMFNTFFADPEAPDMKELYVNEDGTEFRGFCDAKVDATYFTIKDESICSDVENINKLLDNKYNVERLNNCFDRFCIRSIGPKESLEICNALAGYDAISECGIISQRHEMRIFRAFSGINHYLYNDKYLGEAYKDMDGFKDYVESEFPEWSLERIKNGSTDHIVLVQPEDITAVEQLEAAEKIYEATGAAFFVTETIMVASPSTEGSKKYDIDVLNSVRGDANNDGSTTIADAVAILQSIGNKDKYPLSLQGSFNADIVGDFDGITAADALAIQKMDSQGII